MHKINRSPNIMKTLTQIVRSMALIALVFGRRTNLNFCGHLFPGPEWH